MTPQQRSFVQKCLDGLVLDAELEYEHRRGYHILSVPECPVCYNCSIVDARIAAGEPVSGGPLSPGEVAR